MGRNCSPVVMPSAVVLPVSLSTSQSCAMRCIQVPVLDTVWPAAKSRKLRLRSDEKVPAVAATGSPFVVRFGLGRMNIPSPTRPEPCDPTVDAGASALRLCQFLQHRQGRAQRLVLLGRELREVFREPGVAQPAVLLDDGGG